MAFISFIALVDTAFFSDLADNFAVFLILLIYSFAVHPNALCASAFLSLRASMSAKQQWDLASILHLRILNREGKGWGSEHEIFHTCTPAQR